MKAENSINALRLIRLLEHRPTAGNGIFSTGNPFTNSLVTVGPRTKCKYPDIIRPIVSEIIVRAIVAQ